MHPPDEPTPLWVLRRDDEEIACQVRLVPYGIEIDLLRGGALIVTRAFENGDDALAWADRKREERESRGWTRTAPPRRGDT